MWRTDAAIKTVKESRRLYPTSGNHLLKAAAAKAKQVMPSCAQPVSLRSAWRDHNIALHRQSEQVIESGGSGSP